MTAYTITRGTDRFGRFDSAIEAHIFALTMGWDGYTVEAMK